MAPFAPEYSKNAGYSSPGFGDSKGENPSVLEKVGSIVFPDSKDGKYLHEYQSRERALEADRVNREKHAEEISKSFSSPGSTH